MRKSPKKYTKPVGSIKKKPRKKAKLGGAKATKSLSKKRKYQGGGGQNQYALPASFQTTSTLQTLDGDPEKVQEADMSRRQLLRQQRQEQKAEADAIKAEREQNLRQSAGQATEYLAEEGAGLGKNLLKKRAAKKAAEAAAATGASATSTAGSAASNAALTGAQTLSQQGSGMAMTYGTQLSDDILASSVGATGQAAGQAAGQTVAGAAGSTAAGAAGQVAAQGAKAGLMGSTSAAVTPIALAANVAGTAIEHFGGDDDDTTYNAAEIGGGLLAKGGEFAGYGAMLGTAVPGIGNVVGGLVGGAIGLGVGGAQMLNRRRKARAEKSERDARNEARELRASQRYDQAFRDAYTTTGQDLGFNVNQQAQNSYLGPNQMVFRSGGLRMYQNGGAENNTDRGLLQEYILDPLVSTSREAASYMGVPSNLIAFGQNMMGIETPMSEDMFSDAEQQEIKKLIEKAAKEGRSYVTYRDYDREGSVYKQESIAGYTSPQNSVRTTLGQFNFETDKDGDYIVTDSYDFNPDSGDAHNVSDFSDKELKDMSKTERFNKGVEFYTEKGLSPTEAAYRATRFWVAPYAQEKSIPVTARISKKAGGKKLPGGKAVPISNTAVEFKGNKHGQGGKGSDSGIILDKTTEVEGGETMEKMNFSDGTRGDYFFSDHLRLGGISFAKRHKDIVKNGNSRKQIQELAKLQELVAMRQGADENGQRDPAMIAEKGGRRQFQNAGDPTAVDLTEQTFGEFDESTLTGEGMSMPNVPEGQSLDMSGTYGGVTAEQVQETMSMNPWFDWEGFNPSDKEDVKRFQEEYNKRATSGNKVKVDGKFGIQTQSAYIPAEVMPEVVDETVQPKTEEETPAPEGKEEETPEGAEPTMQMPRRNYLGAMAVGASQFLPAAYAAFRKMDPVERVSNEPLGRQRLHRINLNNLRAINQNQVTAFNRSASSGSPSDKVAKIAALRTSQQNDINTANLEANQNRQLASTEAGMEAQRQQAAAENSIAVQKFNTSMKEDRDRYNREEKLGLLTNIADTATGLFTDYKTYQADEDLAQAISGQTGVLDRFDLSKTAMKDYRKAVRKNDINSPFYDKNTGKFMSQSEVQALTAEEYQKLINSQVNTKRAGGRYQNAGVRPPNIRLPEMPAQPDFEARLNPYITGYSTPGRTNVAVGANPSLRYKNIGVGMNVGKTIGQEGMNTPSVRVNYTRPIGRTRRRN